MMFVSISFLVNFWIFHCFGHFHCLFNLTGSLMIVLLLLEKCILWCVVFCTCYCSTSPPHRSIAPTPLLPPSSPIAPPPFAAPSTLATDEQPLAKNPNLYCFAIFYKIFENFWHFLIFISPRCQGTSFRF